MLEFAYFKCLGIRVLQLFILLASQIVDGAFEVLHRSHHQYFHTEEGLTLGLSVLIEPRMHNISDALVDVVVKFGEFVD